MSLILYGTAACHLCELAEAVLQQLELSYQKVDISDDDALFERYGLRIPVLQRDDGVELGWPFDGAQVSGFNEQG